ncbi:hypothetical protein ACN24K_30385 [Streptomyces microflavus]
MDFSAHSRFGFSRTREHPYLRPDPADVQARMALKVGALADAVARLSLLPRRSWLLIVSSIDCLVETVGQETADRLVAVAEQAELEPRPRPSRAGSGQAPARCGRLRAWARGAG